MHISQESIEDVARVSALWPDAIHTCEELQRLEPGRRPCTCNGCEVTDRIDPLLPCGYPLWFTMDNGHQQGCDVATARSNQTCMCGRPSFEGGYCAGFLSGEGPCTNQPEQNRRLVVDASRPVPRLYIDVDTGEAEQSIRALYTGLDELADQTEIDYAEITWERNAMTSTPTDQGDVNL